MSNLFNDLANGKYKLKNSNTSSQKQTSEGNLFNDLASGKYKLKSSASTSAVNKSVKPTNPSDLLKRVTVTDYPTINKLATQQEQQRKEAERQEQERWNNLSAGEKITDPFQTMGANITYGDLGIKENVAWNEYRSKQDDASLQAAQAATKAREEFEQNNDRIGKGNAITKDFAQYLPQLGGQLKYGLGGAAGGAAVGAGTGAGLALVAGQLGPQVAVPEELATVPTAALAGAIRGGKGGYVAGTAKYGYDMMAGNAYKTLLDMGVPNDVALELSGDEALISSLIEGGGAIVDLISLGIGKLAGKGGTTAAKEVAKNRLLAAAKAYGLNLVSEPLEEMAQEKVSIETEKKAAEQAGIQRMSSDWDDFERIKQAGEGALKVAAVSGGLNAGGNYIANKIAPTQQQKQTVRQEISETSEQENLPLLALPAGNENMAYANNGNIRLGDGKTPMVDNNLTYDVVNGRQALVMPDAAENVLREPSQNAEIQQPNATLPTQAEMAQKANMNQIRGNTKLITQRADNKPTDSFQKGLEKFNSKNYTQTDDMVVLDETPQYLYNLGFDADKPLVINMSKLETIMKEPKGAFNNKNQHGITMDVVEQLPKALQNPLNVIKNPKYNKRVVVVTELTDQYGDIIIVPIEMNTDGYIENIVNDVNRINTFYGKENYDIPKVGNDKAYIEYNKDKIVYDVDKDITKKRDTDSDYRLQLPSTAINISNNIISNNDTNINTQYARSEENMPPTQLEQKSKLRNFYQTAQEGSIVDEQYVKDIQKNKSQFEYEPISNQETLTNARNVVNEDKIKAERDFLAFNGEGVSADDVAIAEVLIAEAIKDGDTSKANYLTATLAEKLTQAGQAIQATKIFKRMTPEGMILYAQKEINKANKKIESENPKLYKKLKEEGALPKLDDSDIQKITEYMQEAQNIPDDYWNSRKKEVAIAKAMAVAGNKIPSSMIEKIASIRRSGLLTNIKTLLRNIGSNASFGSLEMLKDIPAAGIDKLTSLVTKERTTTLPNLKAYGKGFAKGAVEGVQDVKENISTAGRGSKYELPSKTFKRQDTYKDIVDAFKNKDVKEGAKKAFRRALSDYEDASMYIVEGTDRPFWQGRFESELANQMKLKGLEYGVDAPTNDMLEAAKTSADYATFKNKNKLSETFGKIKQALNGGQPLGLADVLGFTFTNVPGSVGSKVYNYSPAGIMTSVKEFYNGIKQNGKFDQRKFVDSLSRALVGSGGWALGAYLIGQGIIRGAADDDDDKANAEKQMGLQENSLNISALERLINGEDTTLRKGDKFYSFDWLQPVSAPILIGADVNNAIEQGENAVFTGAKSAVNQIADMSSLSQVSKLFKGYSGVDLAENLLKVAGEFPSSFIPTIWNNAGQLTDEYKRVSYDSTDAYFKTNVNKILAKIPGLRTTLEKQIDTFGNEQKQYKSGNDFWSTFINPGYNSTYDPTPLQEEILRVYQETGDKGVFPITAGGSITFKNETTKLNPKQKMTYQKTSGEYVTQILSKVIETDAYKKFDDTQKATLLKEVISDSNTLGKASVGLKNKTYDDYMKKVNQLGNVPLESYYSAYVAQKGIESDKDYLGRTIENSKSKKVKKAIDDATLGLSKNQRKVLYNIFNVSKAVQ